MPGFFTWLESTGLARTVGESLSVTAWLSAIHLIGFSLVMSSGVIWNLRAVGVLLSAVPPQAIARPARYLLTAGLAVSLLTGFALFAPRASGIAPSGVFQLKMGLLVVVSIFQLNLNALVLSRPTFSTVSLRTSGVLGLALWLSLAGTACWFILFE